MVASAPAEHIIEPSLPIIDAHHHLYILPEASLMAMEHEDSLISRALIPVLRRHPRYVFDEFMADVGSGHNVRATVHIDAETMYRASGPEWMRSVGEVEFINGIAAISASGLFGDVKICAAIVGGGIDLRMGERVEDALTTHIQVAGGRYRGIRGLAVAYDEDSRMLWGGVGVPHLLLDTAFRRGFKILGQLGLSFDVWLFEPQLPELIDLARAFPETRIILDHVGTPLGVGRYAGKREERFPIWCESMRTLARCPCVTVKLGGLGIPLGGFDSDLSTPPATSLQLAEEWRPYIETCIGAFGADRCMFESNFPVQSGTCTYPVLWNAFKRLTAGASEHEKTALFGGTAIREYRLDV